MHPSAAKVATAARERQLDIEIVEFDASTRTAQEAADAIGTTLGQIVKSLCFVVNEQPLICLVSGSNRLDEKKLAKLLGVGRKKVRRASADQVRSATGFAIGGVPPFGHVTPMKLFIDQDLLQYDDVWAAAGTPHAVFRIVPDALVAATAGTVADLRKAL